MLLAIACLTVMASAGRDNVRSHAVQDAAVGQIAMCGDEFDVGLPGDGGGLRIEPERCAAIAGGKGDNQPGRGPDVSTRCAATDPCRKNSLSARPSGAEKRSVAVDEFSEAHAAEREAKRRREFEVVAAATEHRDTSRREGSPRRSSTMSLVRCASWIPVSGGMRRSRQSSDDYACNDSPPRPRAPRAVTALLRDVALNQHCRKAAQAYIPCSSETSRMGGAANSPLKAGDHEDEHASRTTAFWACDQVRQHGARTGTRSTM